MTNNLLYQSVLSSLREVYNLSNVTDIIQMIRAEDMFHYRMYFIFEKNHPCQFAIIDTLFRHRVALNILENYR